MVAQTPAPPLQFEVASIKPTAISGDRALVQALPGRLLLQNFTLRRLILFAYGMQDYQLSGDQAWISTDHYDLEAKAEPNTSVQQMEGLMLRALLEERLHLTVHYESRQLPTYELTIGKAGPKLQHTADGSCVPYPVDSKPPQALAPGSPHPVYCGYPKSAVDGVNRTLDGAGVSMTRLATNLAQLMADRPVIDRTGLTATFDIHLKWSVDETDGPSIFTALQEQLGLKLESAKGPVEALVIDHVEKPSAN
jgi:uncharacterized protein (TIGR03435 family)